MVGSLYEHYTGHWELRNLYAAPNIVRVLKSRRMRWAGNIARIGEKRYVYKGRDHAEDIDIDVRIILEWILRKYGWNMWIGCIWLMIGISGVPL
jgi:hypothetical protein